MPGLVSFSFFWHNDGQLHLAACVFHGDATADITLRIASSFLLIEWLLYLHVVLHDWYLVNTRNSLAVSHSVPAHSVSSLSE